MHVLLLRAAPARPIRLDLPEDKLLPVGCMELAYDGLHRATQEWIRGTCDLTLTVIQSSDWYVGQAVCSRT